MKSRSTWLYLLPAITILAAFFVLPVVRLIPASVSSESGLGLYLEIITNPRYSTSVLSTIVLSVFVTLASLFVGGLSGLFLERHRFWGRDAVVGLITLPLSFPGVVVGFMIIMLGGRNGLIGMFTQGLGAGKLVFAYGMAGLFLGYLYFSIPRVVTTVMAAAKKNGSDVRRSGPNTRSLVVPYSQGRHASSSGSCSLFHWRALFCNIHGGLWYRLYACDRHQRSADHDLHGIYAFGQHRLCGNAFCRSGIDHLDHACRSALLFRLLYRYRCRLRTGANNVSKKIL